MVLQIAVSVLCAVVCYEIFKYIAHLMTLKNYPNGPFPLPVIGNLNLLVNQKVHKRLAEFSKTYGDVYGFSIGMERTVIVNTITPARDALVTKGDSSTFFRLIFSPPYSFEEFFHEYDQPALQRSLR